MNLGNLSEAACQIIGRGRVQTQGSLSLEPVLKTAIVYRKSVLSTGNNGMARM